MMTVWICDDAMHENTPLIEELKKDSLKNVVELALGEFSQEKLLEIRPDILFVSVCSPQTEYQAILEAVKNSGLQTVICLIGNSMQQAVLAYEHKCDYFIYRPFHADELHRCVSSLELLAKRICHIRSVTFGWFEIYVNEIPILFHNAKAKELLALCIDRRGADVSIYEAIDALWPQKSYDERAKRLYRKAVISIHQTLSEYGVGHLFSSRRGSCKIDKSVIECDYYTFLQAPKEHLLMLNGKYLYDYPWAEETLARITLIAREANDGRILEYMY